MQAGELSFRTEKTESLNTLQARLYYHEQKSEDIESVSKYLNIPEQRVIKGREKRGRKLGRVSDQVA
jgi:hypothetical protein